MTSGRAANTAARASVTPSAAGEVVPGYGTASSATLHYRQPNLNSRASELLMQCAGRPDDPICQAQLGAYRSANLPRPTLAHDDPALAAARAINRSPSRVLGSLSDYYAGCTTSTSLRPSRTETRSCLRRQGVGEFSVVRSLVVDVERQPNCDEGTWFARASAQRNPWDSMSVDAQCRIRDDGQQLFRFDARGQAGACAGPMTAQLPIEPTTAARFVTDLSPHWDRACWSDFKVVMTAGSGCRDGRCRYAFEFGAPVYTCPAGMLTGDTLETQWSEFDSTFGARDRCFAVVPPDENGLCPAEHAAVRRGGVATCAIDNGPATLSGASGWTLPLDFDLPALVMREQDRWDDRGTDLALGGRCTPVTPERCTEGPGTRLVNGHPVTRDCWRREATVSCSGANLADDCARIDTQTCVPLTRSCRQQDPLNGRCEVEEERYQCALPPEPVLQAGNCPAEVFCLGDNCFDIRSPADPDFARSMTLLEAGREAGVYLDPDQLRVFKGENNRCRDRLLKNCCRSDGAGAGMHNQSVFGTGSRLVYDILMNADNRAFLQQGLSALLMGGGFSGSFTSYGVTVAINGTALPTGSAVLLAGDSLVIAFDPWSLAVAVVFYAVMELATCSEDEGKLAMKEGAGLCHTVGQWCSSCLRILGSCVSCIEETTSKCCFNSKLARLINVQGRTQLGRGWGDIRSPDCGGFSIAELQSLDFAAMDLSEFYASLVPTLPNLTELQTRGAEQLPNCYFGNGKCR